MADDPLDELYAARPEDFTALRTELAAAAKKRGDTDVAKTISAARKPTTAAWVVNRLVRADDGVRRRLTDLGERLRQAHAEMAGARIRELSAEQRRLVDDLVRMAFEEAELTDPSTSVRDDVTSTLQAAVADPDVAARLGRLAKAEQWSGFGDFGDTASVFTSSRGRKAKTKTETKTETRAEPAADDTADDGRAEHRRRQQEARAALEAAEHAKAEADDALAELQSDRATARLRHRDAQRRLQEAETALAAAEDAYDKGKQASRDAADVVKEAKAQVKALK